ncbi:MAG: hypothetical protein JKY37_25500 [Nannocystaceae bacterium]|nr:hypothetical protein [Nannocystaceae bacterium]
MTSPSGRPEAPTDNMARLQAALLDVDVALDVGLDAGLEERTTTARGSTLRQPPDTGHAGPSDPFFVGRVMTALPARLRGASLVPERRARVLAVSYGGAILLAGVLASLVPEAVAGLSERIHDLAHGATDSGRDEGLWGSWPAVLGVVAAVCGAVLALVPARVDTPAI